MILCAVGFFGFGGLHDFYLGKTGSGFIKLIAINFIMIGSIIDLIKIASGSYLDNSGQPLRQ